MSVKDLLFPSRYLTGAIRTILVVGGSAFSFLWLVMGNSVAERFGAFFIQIYCILNFYSYLFDRAFFIAGYSKYVEGDYAIQFVRFIFFVGNLFLYVFVAFYHSPEG